MREHREIELPPPNDYADALGRAWEDLAHADLARVAQYARADFDRDNRLLRVRLLDQVVSVEPDERRVVGDDGREVPSYLAVLALHYLLGAKPFDPTGKWFTFREFDGGTFYYEAFKSRSIARIIQVFGSQAKLLVEAARSLGGKTIEMGDVGVRLNVFPKLPVAIMVWEGDAELPPSANFLFDSTAGSILNTEDLAVVGGFVAGKLAKQARELSQ